MRGNYTSREANGLLDRFSKELSSRSFGLVFAEAGTVIFLLVVSAVGNALVCNAIIRSRALSFRRILTNIFVFGLAVLDLAMACFCMPLCVDVLLRGDWNFGYLTCQVQGFVACFLLSASLYTMLLTAMNRYVRVVKPSLYNTIFTCKSTFGMLVAVWLLLFLIGVVLTQLNFVEFHFHPGRALCLPFVTNEMKKYADCLRIVFFVIVLIIPGVVITTSYYKVFRTVRRHQLNTASSLTQTINSDNSNRSSCSVEEIKMTRTLFVVMLAFGAVCFSLLAFEAFLTIVNVSKTTMDVPRPVHLTWTVIGLSSCAVNPFIYMMTSREFIVVFRKMLCRRTPRGVVPAEQNN